jgi:hypothetical protein
LGIHELLFSQNVFISSGHEGNAEAAIAMEKLVNQLVKAYAVDILCGYSVGRDGMDSQMFQRICAEHSAVYSQ